MVSSTSKEKGYLSPESKKPVHAVLKWTKQQGGRDTNWRSRAVLMLGKSLLVLGGLETNERVSPTELYVLDVASNRWSKAELQGEGPLPSSFYCAVCSAKKIYVIWLADSTLRLNLNVLSLETMTWETLRYTGDVPPVTSDFSCIISNHKLYLFGGIDSNGRVYNDLFMLDLESNVWSKCKCKGEIPEARCGQAVCTLGSRSLIMFGGKGANESYYGDMYTLNIETQIWTRLIFRGVPPSPRAHHSLSVCNGCLVVFGGRNASQALNDVHLLYISSFAWLPVQIDSTQAPSGRYSHFAYNIRDSLLVFGGKSNSQFFFDIHNLKIDLPDDIETETLHLDSQPQHNSSAHGNNSYNTDDDAADQTDKRDNSLQEDQYTQYSAHNSQQSSPQQQSNSPAIKSNISLNTTIPISLSYQAPTNSSESGQPTHTSMNDSNLSHESNVESQQHISPSKEESMRQSDPVQSMLHQVSKTFASKKTQQKQQAQPSPPPSPALSAIRMNSPRGQVPNKPTTPRPMVTNMKVVFDLSSMQFGSSGDSGVKANADSNNNHVVKTTVQVPAPQQVQVNLNVPQSPMLSARQRPTVPIMIDPVLLLEEEDFQKELFVLLSVHDKSSEIPSLSSQSPAEIIKKVDTSIIQITQRSFLRLMRFCRVLDNALWWDFIVQSIRWHTGATQIIGTDTLTFAQFKRIISDIAKRKYYKEVMPMETAFSGNVDTNTIPSHLEPVVIQMFVQQNLKPFFRTALDNTDQDLDLLLQVSILDVFIEYKKPTQELFLLFSTLGLLSIHHPKWSDIVRNNSTITMAEVLTFTKGFGITPHLIPRHIVAKKIIPACSFSTSSRPQNVPQNQTQTKTTVSPQQQSPQPQEEDVTSLSYPEFLECLGRIALYVFSRYPYSQIFDGPSDKIKALFDKIGFNDKRVYSTLLKNSGLSLKNRTQAPKPEMQTVDTEASLQDESKLKDELLRIFMFYCSFGDQMNLDMMHHAKFSRCVRDMKVYSLGNMLPEDTDVIFFKIIKQGITPSSFNSDLQNTSTGSSSMTTGVLTNAVAALYAAQEEKHSASTGAMASQKMNFPLWLESLKEIASKTYCHIRDPTQQLLCLLQYNVLPNLKRINETFTNVDVNDPGCQQILNNQRKVNTLLFNVYKSNDYVVASESGVGATTGTESGCMTLQGFTRFVTEFEITPTMVSKKDFYRIFRSACQNSSESILYPQFEQCLVRLAAVAYSKHPYNTKYVELTEKLHALYDKIGAYDRIAIRHKLEANGHKVGSSMSPARPRSSLKEKEKRMLISHSNTVSANRNTNNHYDSNSSNVGFLSSNNSSNTSVQNQRMQHIKQPLLQKQQQQQQQQLQQQQQQQQLHSVTEISELPPAKELDAILRDIYTFYAMKERTITQQQFFKFVKDTRIADTTFTSVDSDEIFNEISRNSSMMYESFCDAIAMLAQCKSPGSTAAESLKQLLLKNVLPFARRKSREQASIHLDSETVSMLHKHLSHLREVFNKFSNKQQSTTPTNSTSSGTGFNSVSTTGRSINLRQLLRLCLEFNICPELIAPSDVEDMFKITVQVATSTNNRMTITVSDDAAVNHTLGFESFMECIARLAIRAFSIGAWHEMFSTPALKTKALIDRIKSSFVSTRGGAVSPLSSPTHSPTGDSQMFGAKQNRIQSKPSSITSSTMQSHDPSAHKRLMSPARARTGTTAHASTPSAGGRKTRSSTLSSQRSRSNPSSQRRM